MTKAISELQMAAIEAEKTWRKAEQKFDQALREEAAAFEAWDAAQKAYQNAGGLQTALEKSIQHELESQS